VPAVKKDRVIKKLIDEGYDEGPEPSESFLLAEGDLLDVAYRGNVQSVDPQSVHRAIFTTNLDTTYHMQVSLSLSLSLSLSVMAKYIYISKVYVNSK